MSQLILYLSTIDSNLLEEMNSEQLSDEDQIFEGLSQNIEAKFKGGKMDKFI